MLFSFLASKPVKQGFLIFSGLLILGLILFKSGLLSTGPTLESLSPSMIAPGAEITISGKNLGGDPGRTVVYFNDVQAKPMQVTAESLVVRVPPEAESGVVYASIGMSITNQLFIQIMPSGHPGGPHGGMDKLPAMGGMGGMGMGSPHGGSGAIRQQADPEGEEGIGMGEGGGSPHEFFSAAAAKPMIDVELLSSEGKKIKLSDFKGKVIALNFWATWCKPCLEEVPSLERLTQRAGAMGLEILAVSVDGSFDDVKKALPNTKLNVYLDPNKDAATKWGTLKFPETWVINKEGKIVARFIGARNWDSPLFENFFSRLLKGEDLQ